MMSGRTEPPRQYNQTKVATGTDDTKLSNGTTHCLTDDTKLSNGTTHYLTDDTKLSNRTTHYLTDDTKLSNGTTHYLTDDTKLSNGTSHRPAEVTKLFNGTSHRLSDEMKLSDGTAHHQANDTKLSNGTSHRSSGETKWSDGTAHHQANVTKLSNGTTRHLAGDAKLSYEADRLPADDTDVSYSKSSPDARDPKVPTLADVRMAGVRASPGGAGRRLAGATSKRLRLKSLRSLSTTDDSSQSGSQMTGGGHVGKKERKKILEEMETKSKLTDYLVSRLDHRVETLDLYLNVSLDDELFLARKEMVPWRFRRSEKLDKKWKTLNHVITAQEFVLAVQQARANGLKAVGTSAESVDTPGQTVSPPSQTVDNSGHTAGPPSQTVDIPGQSAKTHMRISAQELRNYLLKDVSESDGEVKTLSSVDQSSGEDALDTRLRTKPDLQSDPSTALGSSVMPAKSQYPVVGRGTRYANRKRLSKNTKSTEDGDGVDTEGDDGTLVEHVDLGANGESQPPVGDLSNAGIEISENQKVSSDPKQPGHHNIIKNEIKVGQKQLTSSHFFKRSQTPNIRSKFSALELHFLNSPISLIEARLGSELKKTKFARNAQNRTQDGGHRPVYAFGSHYIPKTCQYCGSYACKGYQRRSRAAHQGSRTADGDNDCGHHRSMISKAFMSRVQDIKGIYEQRQAVSHAVYLRVAQRLQRVGVPQTSRAARDETR